MANDLDEVLALKADAKTARDDGDWEAAISDLEEAIALLRSRAAGAPQQEHTALAAELADAYGLIGGIQKRWALLLDSHQRELHLQASVAAYDNGYHYEKDLPPKHANSYNLVNRLVGRALLNPGVLLRNNDTVIDMADELRRAEEILISQIGSTRQKDPWAYCDLGTVRLLRGTPDAWPAFRQLDRLRPPAFVYDSTLATLQTLCEAASDLRPDLEQVIELLRRSARHSE